MKRILISFFVLLISNNVFAKTDIEFILDVSGSMRQLTDGKPQIDIAREQLLAQLPSITGDTQVALRVYSHRIEQANKAESCKDTELMIPFAAVDKTVFETKLKTLTPKGYTPIAYSLEQSKADFNTTREADKVIILLSDGEETCGGDPVATVKKMIADGFKVVVNVIGFNVDDVTRKQLSEIANAGGGQYFDAKGSAGLTTALKNATQASLVIDKAKTTYGNEIKGGDSYETAVPVELGKEYKLNHHQKVNFFDYFYVDLKAGQELTASVSTLEKGVDIDANNKATENQSPYAGIQLHDGSRNRLKSEELIGAPNATKTVTASAGSDGRFYVLLGSTYDAMNKDHVTFKISVLSRGDLGGETDAGDSMEKALPITYQRYPVNFLTPADKNDTFKFEAKKGDIIAVGYIPNAQNSPSLNMDIMDGYKQKLFHVFILADQGKKTDPINIPEDGTYYLSIFSDYSIDSTFGYTLELMRVTPPSN
ncbi:VWA domain-containing protein [bacterium]|nr:VWA domain-containing protein [bacterium]